MVGFVRFFSDIFLWFKKYKCNKKLFEEAYIKITLIYYSNPKFMQLNHFDIRACVKVMLNKL